MSSAGIVFALLASLLCGCAFDQRKEISYRILYKADGFEDDAAFLAALSAKFPPGTPATRLQDFVVETKGKCWTKDGLLTCEAPTRARLCQARLIRIEAALNGDAIKSLKFISSGLGC